MGPGTRLMSTDKSLAGEILNQVPAVAAKSLIGWSIFIRDPESFHTVGGIICETEAYLSSHDPAAHNRRGKTAANAALFAEAGTLYVHAMRHHYLLDIVTQDETRPGSVLIRALEPTVGLELMSQRRGVKEITRLCKGPGNVCKSLGIDKRFNGYNILGHESLFKLIPKPGNSHYTIISSKRVGVTQDLDCELRFLAAASPFISK